jgi:hypothetical protein
LPVGLPLGLPAALAPESTRAIDEVFVAVVAAIKSQVGLKTA